MANVVVAGAGIVGVSTAIWLQRAGHSVTLVDREGFAAGTSYGNAGVLASGALVPITTAGLWRKAPGMLFDPNAPLFIRWSYLPRLVPFLWKYMGFATRSHMERYAAEMAYLVKDCVDQHRALAAGTPAEELISDKDYVFGYASQASFEADALGWDMRRKHGVRLDVMTGKDYGKIDPLFDGRFHTVVACKNHGHVKDPGAYVQALGRHFVDSGGSLMITDIEDVEMSDGRCTALLTTQGPVTGDNIVIAMGAWSAKVARKLGLKTLAFESERGYHIELWGASEAPVNPTYVASGKFVISPMQGRLRLAGVVEFGGLDTPPSAAPLALLRRQFFEVLPDVTWEREETWMGHRPAPSDSFPLLGPTKEGSQTYLAFGHQHIGLTAGPKTGRLVADMISNTPSNQDLSAFDPQRYR
ncbi:MAG: FAD-binding oxidoreductase [Pseudomonadota bacterium]